MVDRVIKKDLEKQGYRMVGNHSAIKTCLWTKRSIKCEDVCYKNAFYGIKSWRCIQSSISLFNCSNMCKFCWRCLDHTSPKDVKEPDEPKEILEGFIREQKKYLQGFYGNPNTDEKRIKEAMNPKHVAISLAGDGCLYPLLPEFIEEVHSRGMTSFLVTNGLKPEMLKKLLEKNIKPTQLYITLAAPNEKVHKETCRPLIKDAWKKLMESLSLLKEFDRGTVRLTLVKDMNFCYPKQYGEILKKTIPKFIELKAGMPVGYAQYRMEYKQMPSHKEIKDFSKEVAKVCGYKIVDEKENSRVVLLMKEDKDKFLELDY